MLVSLSELRQKEVIDIDNGARIGYIDDVEIDSETASVAALVVYGRPRFFGLFGREEDFVIKCSQIRVIGDETILISGGKISTNKRSFSFENLSDSTK